MNKSTLLNWNSSNMIKIKLYKEIFNIQVELHFEMVLENWPWELCILIVIAWYFHYLCYLKMKQELYMKLLIVNISIIGWYRFILYFEVLFYFLFSISSIWNNVQKICYWNLMFIGTENLNLQNWKTMCHGYSWLLTWLYLGLTKNTRSWAHQFKILSSLDYLK